MGGEEAQRGDHQPAPSPLEHITPGERRSKGGVAEAAQPNVRPTSTSPPTGNLSTKAHGGKLEHHRVQQLVRREQAPPRRRLVAGLPEHVHGGLQRAALRRRLVAGLPEHLHG